MTGPATLHLSVDVGNGTPPYEQLRSQLAGLVHTGVLVAGRGRAGTVVTGTHGDPARARLRAAANRLVAAARSDGLDDDTVLTVVHAALTAAADR